MRRQSSSTIARIGVTLALVLLATSCSGEDTGSTTSSSPSSTSPNIESPVWSGLRDDGVLRIGLLVPLTDPQAEFGSLLVPIVEVAVSVINAQGGFNGQPVDLVVADEGRSTDEARAAAKDLVVNGNVDVVIGPFSSLDAPSVVPALIASEVGVCSPSVTSLTLDKLSNSGLFIRTAAQDSDIATRMVELAVESGSEVFSLAYPEDPYGRDLARFLITQLERRNLTVATEVAYAVGATNYSDVMAPLLNDDVPVDLVITNGVDGQLILDPLLTASSDSLIITNDNVVTAKFPALAGVAPESRPQLFGFAVDAAKGADELLNIARITDPDFPEQLTSAPPFTVNTLDCLVLMWLAATAAGSDAAPTFMKEVLELVNDGASCLWITDCKYSVDKGFNVDYNGINELNLSESLVAIGRPLVAFQIDGNGNIEIVEGDPEVSPNGPIPG